MKKITQLLVSGLLLLLLTACGQKGPLILEGPATKTVSTPKTASTPKTGSSATTQNVEKTEVEVLQDEPVLNIQTDETSTIR